MQRTKSIYEGTYDTPTPPPGTDSGKDKKTKGEKSKAKTKPTPKGDQTTQAAALEAYEGLQEKQEFLAEREALEVKATRFDYTFEGATKKKNVDTDEEGKFLSTSSNQLATIVSPVALEYRDPNDRS